jgi:hypothetical protein
MRSSLRAFEQNPRRNKRNVAAAVDVGFFSDDLHGVTMVVPVLESAFTAY